MAMPSSGCIGITTCPNGTCSSICAAVYSACGFQLNSLSALSTAVGKTAPHCMTEFYGYSPALPLSLSTTSCSQSSTSSYNCGVIVGMNTTGHWASLTIRYFLDGSACNTSCASVCLVCNGTTVCTCSLIATNELATGTWVEYLDYNDSICFVTKTKSGFVLIGGSSATQARLCLESISNGSGSYCIGSPDSVISTSTCI